MADDDMEIGEEIDVEVVRDDAGEVIGAVVDDVIVALIDRELREIQPDGLILKRADFERVRDAVQKLVVDETFAAVSVIAKIALAAREASKAIAQVTAFEFLTVLTAEREHIEQLIEKLFISRAGLSRLPRIEVYLRAIKQRIERLLENPGRDSQAQVEFDRAYALYAFAGGTMPLATGANPKLQTVRWLLEELRVSLCAQNLGAAEKVSV